MSKNININIYKLLKISLIMFAALAALFTASMTAKAAFTLTTTNAITHSDTQINLNWTSVANSVYYKVSRNNVPITTIDVATERNYLSYADTDLLPQTSYNYEVTAVNSDGQVLQTVSASTRTTQMKAPSIASSYIDLNKKLVTLTWVNNSHATASTTVSKPDEGVIATLGNDGTSITFTDPALKADTKVKYILVSSDGKSHTSPYSSAITITPIKLPSITATLVNKVNTISWDANSNIKYFVLERSEYLEDSWGPWKTILDEIDSKSISVTDTLSNDGTFRYRLSINTEEFIGYSNISNPVTRLFSPTDLQCVPVGINRIDLSWTNPPGNDYNLKIERKNNFGNYSTLAILDSNISTYSDTNNIELDTGYYYRVSAYNSKSSSTSSATYYILTSPPSPVYSLKADMISATKVTLNWEDNCDNESGFIIERKTDSGSFSKIATLAANINTYTDNSLTVENTYTYRIMAYNPFGNAESYSNELSISTSLLKDPPASLTTSAISTSQIKLTWVYSDSSSYSTAIERKMGSKGSWEIVTTLPAGFTSYTDINLSANNQYHYRVKTVIADNIYSKPYPNTENGADAHTKLLPPQGVTAVWSSANTIKLKWLNKSYEAEYFLIERKTNNGAFMTVDTPSSDDGYEWYNSSLKSGTTYTYRLKSINGDYSSDYTEEVTVEGIKIAPPTNLKATIISGTEISLSWEDNSSNETKFKIEQKSKPDGSWNEIGALIANTTAYSIKNLKSDTLYTYRVTAYNSTYFIGAESNECEVMIKALSPPSDLTLKVVSSSEINLGWVDNSTGEEGFVIERKSSGKDFVEIARTGPNIVKYTDNNLQAGKEYYYRVKAFNGTLYTNYTNITANHTNAPKTFSDLNSVPWAKKAIENLAGRGIIRGKSTYQNKFAPNDKITRAEFINLVVISLQFSKTPVGTFEDVKPEHWFYKNVMIAKNMGIVSGIGNNLFYPNEPIRREDMAVILARALKISGNPLPNHDIKILDKYSDRNSISDYALLSMAILNGEKIINGKSSTILAPKDYATRAEAAVILYNILYQDAEK